MVSIKIVANLFYKAVQKTVAGTVMIAGKGNLKKSTSGTLLRMG